MDGTKASACPLDCPDACSLEVTVESGRVVSLDGTRKNPLTDGFLCGKVRRFGEHVHHAARILHPLIREGAKGAGAFRRASWDEALARVAERLRVAREASGGASILPLSYGGSNGSLTQDTTDEILFARLGASRLLRTVCAAPTGVAVRGLYGGMPGTSLEDYPAAELIVIWGANPAATGIHLVPIVRRAQERGARLVVIDPRRTKLARQADLHLALRPGTDLPLALAVHRWLFEGGAADLGFLAEHATGVEELRRRAGPWSIERAAREAGIDPADLEGFARMYAGASPAVIRCGWGLERNRNGGSAACAILALPAVAGKLGRRGGGYTLSSRGAWRLAPAVAPESGWSERAINMNVLGRALLEVDDPPIEVLFVYNANPLATLPDQERVLAGLLREDLFTVVHDQVLTDTARHADVVLPATTFLEHDELRLSYGIGVLQRSAPVLPPVGESRPNHAVFAELARRTGVWRDGDPEEPGDLVAAVLAHHPGAMRALEADGIALPDGGTNPIQLVDVLPGTPDRRVQLVPDDLDRQAPGGLYAYRPDPGDPRHPLALISPATERTISSTLGELHTAPVPVELHPDDAASRGIADGDPVRVHNALGEVHTLARITPHLRPGVACLPKGLWMHNTKNARTANALVPDTLTDLGGGACFNDARVEVEGVGIR